MTSQSLALNKFFDALPIFGDLTPSQLEQARAITSVERVESGHVLLTAQTSSETVYLVAKGSVRICAHGSGAIIGLRGAGEVLGEMSVLDGSKHSATVIAQQPSVLLCVSCADFWEVLWEMPPFAYNLMRLLTQRTRSLTAQVQALSSLPMTARLARQLVILAEEFGQPAPTIGAGALLIPFELTQSQLAALVGAPQEQVSQLLARWTNSGFIGCNGANDDYLVVCQSDELRQLYEGRGV